MTQYEERVKNQAVKLAAEEWANVIINTGNFDFDPSVPSYIGENLYRGNICLDFGSAEGSSSLYSRSNGIIEAGGLILQSKQIDSENIWGNLENKIIFKNFNDLENLISQLLNNEQFIEKCGNEYHI